MCVGSSYPAPGGAGITELKPGDEITIRAGFGHPSKEEDATDIVLSVDVFSALTASGICLGCFDGNGVEKTGRHFEDGEYEVNQEAMGILEETGIVLSQKDPLLQ